MRINRMNAWWMAAWAVVMGAALMGQVQPPAGPATRPSPPGVTYATVEGTYPSGKGIVIYYSRPNIVLNGQKRVIWGTLVPWGQVWRLGANEATLMVTPVDLVIGDVVVPAGAYTLFMLPVENGDSKLIINKMVGQIGTVYDEKMDLGRVTMKKDMLATNVDQLIVALVPKEGGGGATLKVAWEGLQFSVEMKVKK
jgi:Protein of unknown function (DUF2911)